MDVKKRKLTYEAIQWDDSRPLKELTGAMEDMLSRAGRILAVDAISSKCGVIGTPDGKPTYLNESDWLLVRSDGKVKVLSSEDFDRRFEGKF